MLELLHEIEQHVRSDNALPDGFLQYLLTNEDSESSLRQRYSIEDGTWSTIIRRVTDAAYRDVSVHGTNHPDVLNAVFCEG